jgi:hypothetical protein
MTSLKTLRSTRRDSDPGLPLLRRMRCPLRHATVAKVRVVAVALIRILFNYVGIIFYYYFYIAYTVYLCM